ncbi:MAG: hypothetical protein QXM68_03120 [Candidatus Aenigmatarchaeota archaeon]|nr:hypothetical protein [Candidatus Aenigmarchaeota archaeon]
MKGLNEFMTLGIIVLISITLITISINYIKPIIERSNDNFALNEGLSNLILIKNTIEEISSESQGSSRTIKLRSYYGVYIFDSLSDTINFTHVKSSDVSFYGNRNGINVTTSGNVIMIFTKIDNIDIMNSLVFTKGDNILKISYDSFDNGLVKINITS